MHLRFLALAFFSLIFSLPGLAQKNQKATPNTSVQNTVSIEQAEQAKELAELKKRKNINISMNGLYTLAGLPTLSMDVRIGQVFTVGPSFGFLRSINLDEITSPLAFGVNTNIFLTNTVYKDSWLLNISHMTFQLASLMNNKLSISLSNFHLNYQWFWNSGFNIGTGFGATQVTGGVATTEFGKHEFQSGLFPMLAFNLGMAF